MMNNRIAFSLYLAIFLAAITIPVAPVRAKPPLRFAVKRQEFRNNYIRFESIVEALDITEGMSILDIGSGPGYASFLFAEKLHGTGAVYATEIREDFVNYIAEEAQRKGITNLFPVQVDEDGLDAFYGEHRYDLVFLSNVYHALDNRLQYFSTLRNYLKPGGRLVLVIYNQTPLFSVSDVTDLDGLRARLAEDNRNASFVRNLSPSTRELLKAKGDETTLAKALVGDFNAMLQDIHFYNNFYKDSYFDQDLFTSPERQFANWLLMTLREEGVLEKSTARISSREKRSIIKLNRLFFQSRLGDCLANGGRGAYLPAGDANRHTSKYVVFRELSEAGYTFADDIQASPYFDTLIMVPATPE